MMGQAAALKEVANGKLRRLLVYSASFKCVDVQIVDAVLFRRAANRKRTRRWRGPAKISDVDKTGMTAGLQPQTFMVACYCVRMEMETTDVEEVE